ncbi:hypothetical protein [Kutzneria albida]|uniref:hypothetical protein n=1 Tax=Kutzneria albida TaxID=43357 RepID=UPI00046D3446|nr:hypothetical protein [Kutzneria albida]
MRLDQRISCTAEPINIARRQLLAEGGPLMPDATGRQAELEAALLPAVTLTRTDYARPIVLQTRPSNRALSLEIVEDAVESLLAAWLPARGEHHFGGVPGLRPRPGRDHLDLHVLDAKGQVAGLVRLLGVSRRRWRAAASQLVNDEDCTPVWLLHQHEFTETEQRVLFHLRRTAKPIQLMSAVLRRLALWRDAMWIETSAWGKSLWVCWGAEPQATVLTELLHDKACRIPGAFVTPERLPGQAHGIVFSLLDNAACTPPFASRTTSAQQDEEDLERRRFLACAAAIFANSVPLSELWLATPRLSNKLGHFALRQAEAAIGHARALAAHGRADMARGAAAVELHRLRDLPTMVPTPELAVQAQQVLSELTTLSQHYSVIQ